MAGPDLWRGDEHGNQLLADISNAFVRMQKEYWGLGPVRAKSYMMDDLLLIVMRGGLTRAERTMLEFGEPDLVRHYRQTFENKMTANLTKIIEDLTGRKVLTYQSQILFDPDIVAELFVFDKAAGAGAREIVATAEGQLRGRPRGVSEAEDEVQDATGSATPETPAAPAVPAAPAAEP
jgi:uncharacterized protein YbcI